MFKMMYGFDCYNKERTRNKAQVVYQRCGRQIHRAINKTRKKELKGYTKSL